MITTEVITDLDRLTGLRNDWVGLWTGWGRGNPFTHPDWVINWLNHLGRSVEPLIAVAWDNGELIGLAPLGRDRCMVWRRLVFLGSPDADYPDWLVSGDDPRPVLDRLIGELLTQKWAWLDLEDVAEDSLAGRSLIDCLARAGLAPIARQTIPCPALAVTGTWDELWSSKKRKFRYNLKRSLRLLEENEGPVEFQSLAAAADLKKFVNQAVGIHAARWAERHTRSIFSQGAGPQFFDEVIPALAEQGLVRLDLLTVNQAPISFALSFISPTRLYYYIAGFDPEFGQYSPGALLLRRMVKQAHIDGVELFDFMKGEESYKQHWANQTPSNSLLLAGRSGLWPKIGLWIRKNRSRLRTWARQVESIRKIYFGIMDTKKKMGHGPNSQADNQR